MEAFKLCVGNGLRVAQAKELNFDACFTYIFHEETM